MKDRIGLYFTAVAMMILGCLIGVLGFMGHPVIAVAIAGALFVIDHFTEGEFLSFGRLSLIGCGFLVAILAVVNQ